MRKIISAVAGQWASPTARNRIFAVFLAAVVILVTLVLVSVLQRWISEITHISLELPPDPVSQGDTVLNLDPRLLYRESGPTTWLETVFDVGASDIWPMWVHHDPVSGRGMLFSHGAKVIHDQEPYVKHIFDQLLCNVTGKERTKGKALFVDAGGHVGFYSLLARVRGCDVVTVEIQPSCAEMMRFTERANSITPPTPIVGKPLLDKNGHKFFMAERAGPGGCEGTFSVFWHGPVAYTSVTLDTMLAPVRRHIDLLKLDVEGFEPQVLVGATRLIQQQRVTAVIMEATWWPNVFNPVKDAYHRFKFVFDHGYSIRCVSPEDHFAFRNPHLWINYGESGDTVKKVYPDDPNSILVSVCAEYLVCLEPCPFKPAPKQWD